MGWTELGPGERAVKFINNLTLCDDFRGQPFTLRPWQAEIVRTLFGTIRPDGLRQYRKCLLMLPRKQAKTQLSAGIGVYGLLGTGKQGQETVTAASDRAQASHLFRKAAEMIESDDFLRKRAKIYHSARVIEARKTGNILKVLSSDGRRQHGLNPSLILFDELHTQPNRDLYDALTSALAARSEPLTILISTAGNRRDSLCYEEFDYARKVKARPDLDPEYLPILYGADPGDDWTDEAVWRKAMPALGDFANIDFIRGECRKAKLSSSEESKFRQLYLNQWVASVAKWLNREAWDRCGAEVFNPAELVGRPCFAGLDLSNTSDITAFVLVFPMDDGSFRVVCHFWIPRDYAEERDRKGNTHYLKWAEAGHIELTSGGYIDHALIWSRILELSKVFAIKEIRIDPHEATQTANYLLGQGLPAVYMRQGFLTMNEPTKFLEIQIARGALHHGNNPVLDWMADNAVAELDSYSAVKISKRGSADKVDGLVALVMALGAAMGEAPEEESDILYI